MKTEIRDLWVEALRSGEYEQGRSALRPEKGRFCCLGVLCDLHSLANKAGEGWSGESYAGWTNYLPAEVRDWAGLDANDPAVTDSQVYKHFCEKVLFDGEMTLGILNDDGFGFEKIADIIEKEGGAM